MTTEDLIKEIGERIDRLSNIALQRGSEISELNTRLATRDRELKEARDRATQVNGSLLKIREALQIGSDQDPIEAARLLRRRLNDRDSRLISMEDDLEGHAGRIEELEGKLRKARANEQELAHQVEFLHKQQEKFKTATDALKRVQILQPEHGDKLPQTVASEVLEQIGEEK